ncbi:MAG: histidine kinase dimerization/phospho-acceptor domain-containing protein, partial [Acidimicrobiia bacterium]
MQATLPTRRSAPVVTLGRIRSWLVLASAGVIVAISELLGTLGSEPVDALRMTVSFVLVAGAAALYGLAVRWVFDQGTGQVREYFEANLASSKDTFIANVSHGLRTPLTGVVGFSHLLKSADLGPEDQESVKMIIAESAHPRPDATSSSLPIFRS